MSIQYEYYLFFIDDGEYSNLPVKNIFEASEAIERLNSQLDTLVIGVYNPLNSAFHWSIPSGERSLHQQPVDAFLKSLV